MSLTNKFLYLVSFQALRDEKSHLIEGTKAAHVPAMIVAASTEEAFEVARDLATTQWPIEQGWTTRSATIRRVTDAFVLDRKAKGLIFGEKDLNTWDFMNFDDPFADL